LPYRLLVKAASRASGRLGWARGAVGALLGITAAALMTPLILGPNSAALPWLVAPVGASAVLVFVLPASPLAQPWPVLGGNLISTAVGLAVGHFMSDAPLAAAVAVAVSIAAMSAARCLHPPGGACAMLGAMGGPLIAAAGWPTFLFALWLDLLAMLFVALWYNNLTGHTWPHQPPTPAVLPTALPPERWIDAYDPRDLDAVLENWEEVLDVSRDDLDALFRAVERETYDRVRHADTKT
jgi:CBS domain-containing membrane protein